MFSIYSCPKCGSKLDKLALRTLWKKKKWKKVIRTHSGLMGYLMGHGPDVIWFFVFHQMKCYCGWVTYAVHRMRFILDSDVPVTQKDLHLIDVVNASFDVDGLYLGRRIKGMIAAFLNRWNRLADIVLICSPFISSRFTSGEWEWLMKQLYPYKFYIITRPPSFGFRKRLPIFKVFKEKNKEKAREEFIKLAFTDLDEFEEKVISPLWADEHVIRRKKFHAKYYAGLFPDHVEMIHSSFNLFEREEQQLENVAFEIYPPAFFYSKFIKPFSIDELRVPADAMLEQTDRVGCAVCYEKKGEFDVRFWNYKQRSWEIINRFLSEIRKL